MNKIDGVNPVTDRMIKREGSQVAYESPKQHSSHNQSKPDLEDNVDLSATSKHLQAVAEKIQSEPDVDMKKVEAIRAAIADGSYRVDAEQVAEKLMRFESALYSEK